MRLHNLISPAALTLLAACDSYCSHVRPIPVSGSYSLDAVLRYDVTTTSPVVDATLQASDQELVVEYARADGTRWKATYRVAERHLGL